MGWFTTGRSTSGRSYPNRPNPRIPTTGGKGHGCTSASARRNKKR